MPFTNSITTRSAVKLDFTNAAVHSFTGISKMQVFVELMLGSSSGDHQIVNELLTNLLTVATAYASLIYDSIPQDASNDVLVDRCERIWKALEKTPNLSELLVSYCFNVHMHTYHYTLLV